MLPGSKLATDVLNKLHYKHTRLYTQQRKRDRSYKIYGRYLPNQVRNMIRELTALGAKNVRAVPSVVGVAYSGVRFEY